MSESELDKNTVRRPFEGQKGTVSKKLGSSGFHGSACET
jgi:hypothetical protein